MAFRLGRSPPDTVPPSTTAAVPDLARLMMRCRGTVILGALRAQSGGPVQNELTFREMVNGISALFAVMTPDGAVEDVNHAVLDYFGKSLEELKQWASTDAVHPDDLPGVIAVWSRSLESGEPYDLELRQRGADSVYRWFRVQGLPVRDAEGGILRWCVLQTDIDERKRAEGLLAGENLVLKMTAKGSSLESILEAVCRIVEQTASGCRCSVLLFDPSGSTIQQAVAPSLPSSYSSWFPGTPVDRQGGPCTAAARRKTQVIVSDVAADTQWDVYGWRTAALAHGLKACWSTTIPGSSGLVLGTFAIYWREPRTPTRQDQTLIEQMTHLAAVAIEHKRNEGVLRESAHELRQLVDSVPGMILVIDAAGQQEYANKRFLDYAGKTEIKGLDGLALIHPDDQEAVNSEWLRCMALGRPLESIVRVMRFDGVYRWMHSHISPFKDERGSITRWYGLLSDIDDQRGAEERLRQSEQELRLIFETMPAMVYTMDPEGDLEPVNERLLAFLGAKSLAFNEWSHFIHPDDCAHVLAVWQSTTAASQPYDIELRLRRSDGIYRWFNSRGTPMKDAEGDAVRWYALLTDIDDRKSAEDALHRTETRLSRARQAAAVAELSASIAHEINQPLASVVTNAHACQTWLAHDPPNLERALATLDRIVRDGHSAAEVLRRIRALFKERAPVKSQTDVNQIIGEVLRVLSDELRANGVIVDAKLEVDLPKLEADHVQIQQTLINLVHNAIEAMAGVTDRAKTLVLRSSRQEEELLIQVRDAGVGVKDPALIFEPFVTSKESGMGMGLSIARTIVEAHGGRVWATANEDAGMTFAFTLPLAVAGTV
jgi:PAS domain S-box-containing protein